MMFVLIVCGEAVVEWEVDKKGLLRLVLRSCLDRCSNTIEMIECKIALYQHFLVEDTLHTTTKAGKFAPRFQTDDRLSPAAKKEVAGVNHTRFVYSRRRREMPTMIPRTNAGIEDARD